MASINGRNVDWIIIDNLSTDLIRFNMSSSYGRITRRSVLFHPQDNNSYSEGKKKEAEKKALGLKRFL